MAAEHSHSAFPVTISHVEASLQVVTPPSSQPAGHHTHTHTHVLHKLCLILVDMFPKKKKNSHKTHVGLMWSLCFSWIKAAAIPPAPEFRYC